MFIYHYFILYLLSMSLPHNILSSSQRSSLSEEFYIIDIDDITIYWYCAYIADTTTAKCRLPLADYFASFYFQS